MHNPGRWVAADTLSNFSSELVVNSATLPLCQRMKRVFVRTYRCNIDATSIQIAGQINLTARF